MPQIQHSVVAGLFYPGTPQALRETVDNLMHSVHAGGGRRPLALIAPHAGFEYSGPIAATAYATIAPFVKEIDRVAVLAPSHRLPFYGIALSSADWFETPLGEVAVDRVTVERLAELPGVVRLDEAFAQEHALEVQLPFLQHVLGDFELVPLIVGQAEPNDVAALIEALQRDDTLIVVSSDLSHYHSYADCQARDRATTVAIEQLSGEKLAPEQACGAYPIRGLLSVAKARHWQVKTLDLRNSGDTSGDKARVVGYGAYAFYQ